METCGACGANLSGDIDWCPRCYAPARGRTGGPAAAAPGPAGGLEPAPAQPLFIPSGRVGFAPPPPEEPVHHSRWRAGPTSFGPVGRLLLSVGVLVLGVLAYVLILVNVGIPPSPSSGLVFAIVYTPVAVWMWSRIWRPERTR